MKIICGLGNPGKKYEGTRHNFGFMALDAFAKKHRFSIEQSKHEGLYSQENIFSEKVIFVKPQTYMNLSGKTVAPFANFYKVAPKDILVIFDDLDMPLGRLKFARKGSAGGHNGIKSMIQCLGTQDFPRLKLGIGRPVHPKQDVSSFVLQKFSGDQGILAEQILDIAVEAIEEFIRNDVGEAMNRFNGTDLLK